MEQPAIERPDAVPRYSIDQTAVHEVAVPQLGRSYPVYVALPASYDRQPDRRYPVLFVTGAPYAFPLLRAISRRVGDSENGLEDFILVGLGYASGDTPTHSRRRDYTPTANGPASASTSDMPGRPVLHGEGERYLAYIRDQVFPFVASHYRTEMQRKTFAGHSYGSLLGAQILLSDPDMFNKYILNSPSLWLDQRVMFQRARDYLREHRDLRADVLLTVGSFETVKPGSHDPRFNREEDMISDNAEFTRLLDGAGYPNLHVASLVIAGEDHLTVNPVSYTRGLQWAFPARNQQRTAAL